MDGACGEQQKRRHKRRHKWQHKWRHAGNNKTATQMATQTATQMANGILLMRVLRRTCASHEGSAHESAGSTSSSRAMAADSAPLASFARPCSLLRACTAFQRKAVLLPPRGSPRQPEERRLLKASRTHTSERNHTGGGTAQERHHGKQRFCTHAKSLSPISRRGTTAVSHACKITEELAVAGAQLTSPRRRAGR